MKIAAFTPIPTTALPLKGREETGLSSFKGESISEGAMRWGMGYISR